MHPAPAFSLHAASAASALCAAMPLPDAAAPPLAIHLLPAGKITTVDGRGPYLVKDATALAAAFEGRAPVDENHATDLAAPLGGPSPARGWITGLEARADGIWGNVEWTEGGKALLADRAYRGISPVIEHDSAGNITGILRASLVNNPNLRGLATLHQENSMDLLTLLRQALGLPETADGAACMAALGKLKDGAACAQAAWKPIAKAAGLAETADGAAVLLAVQSLAASAQAAWKPIAKAAGLAETADGAAVLLAVQSLADPARMVPAAQVAALQAQFTTLQTNVAKDKAESFVDAAIKAGKVGVKPLKEHYIARHMADPAAVEKEIGAMISLQGRSSSSANPPAAAGKVPLEGNEARIIALLGIDPDAYRKTKAALAVKDEEETL